MASLVVTNTFVAGTTILAAAMNTNFDDVETYVNNRNSGAAAWERVLATNSSSVPLVINNSTGTNDIANFQDNGSNVLVIADGGDMTFTGEMLGPTGTVSLPTYSFSADPNTGMFRGAADDLRFATGGTLKMRITTDILPSVGLRFDDVSSTTIQGNDGTASLPFYTFAADTNTGIFRAGADELRITVGGTSRIQVATGDTRIVYSSRELTYDGTTVFCATDNVVGLGKSGARYTDVWATNGTIQTSISGSKTNIEPVEKGDIKIPSPIYFTRPGEEKEKQQLGFEADSLPQRCFAVLEDGTRSTDSIYTSAVIGMLCAAVRDMESRLIAKGI